MASAIPNTTPPETPQRRRARTLSGTQVMFAIILAIGLMLAINFSSRVSADRQLSGILNAVEREIETLRIEQGGLIKRLDYVNNDAYVGAWARSEGRMVREGEVLVQLSPSNNPTLNNNPLEVTTPTLEANVRQQNDPWQLWWSLFFDAPPPSF